MGNQGISDPLTRLLQERTEQRDRQAAQDCVVAIIASDPGVAPGCLLNHLCDGGMGKRQADGLIAELQSAGIISVAGERIQLDDWALARLEMEAFRD